MPPFDTLIAVLEGIVVLAVITIGDVTSNVPPLAALNAAEKLL
jgi:hypothetical protein